MPNINALLINMTIDVYFSSIFKWRHVTLWVCQTVGSLHQALLPKMWHLAHPWFTLYGSLSMSGQCCLVFCVWSPTIILALPNISVTSSPLLGEYQWTMMISWGFNYIFYSDGITKIHHQSITLSLCSFTIYAAAIE